MLWIRSGAAHLDGSGSGSYVLNKTLLKKTVLKKKVRIFNTNLFRAKNSEPCCPIECGFWLMNANLDHSCKPVFERKNHLFSLIFTSVWHFYIFILEFPLPFLRFYNITVQKTLSCFRTYCDRCDFQTRNCCVSSSAGWPLGYQILF